MSGLKIMCIKLEHIVLLDTMFFLPFPVRKLPEAYCMTAYKSCYPNI